MVNVYGWVVLCLQIANASDASDASRTVYPYRCSTSRVNPRTVSCAPTNKIVPDSDWDARCLTSESTANQSGCSNGSSNKMTSQACRDAYSSTSLDEYTASTQQPEKRRAGR